MAHCSAYPWQAAEQERVGKIQESFEFIILNFTLKIIFYVCRLRTKDIISRSITRNEKALLVVTLIRLLIVMFQTRIQPENRNLQMVWLVALLITLSFVIAVIRDALNEKTRLTDGTIVHRERRQTGIIRRSARMMAAGGGIGGAGGLG